MAKSNRLRDPLGDARLFQLWLTRRLYRQLDYAIGKLARNGHRMNKSQFLRRALWEQIQTVLSQTEIEAIDTELRREKRQETARKQQTTEGKKAS